METRRLSTGSGHKKRKKQRDSCPNPLFIHWLTEWTEEAASRHSKTQYTYAKALRSLKKYPATLYAGKECRILEYFGDKLCKMLDDKLAKYVAEYGTTDPVPGIIPTPGAKRSRTRTKVPNADLDTIDFNQLSLPLPPKASCAQQQLSSPGGSTARLTADSSQSDNEIASRGAGGGRKSKRRSVSGQSKGRKSYLPQRKSGPYAIILTLYHNSERAQSLGYMSKAELMREAQPLSDKSFTIPDPGSRYTAWSSMGTLIKKGFVLKNSNPARYHLTDDGRNLGERLLRPEGDEGRSGGGSGGADVLTLSAGERLPQPAARHRGTAMADDCDRGHDAMAVSEGLHRLGDNIPDLNVASLGGSPSVTDSGGLLYCFIDEQGHEVREKDKAVVTVDDEISIGFLIKCKYEDLLMSSKRYKLETNRLTTGDEVYAYLHNDDAGNIAPGTAILKNCPTPPVPVTVEPPQQELVKKLEQEKPNKKFHFKATKTKAASSSGAGVRSRKSGGVTTKSLEVDPTPVTFPRPASKPEKNTSTATVTAAVAKTRPAASVCTVTGGMGAKTASVSRVTGGLGAKAASVSTVTGGLGTKVEEFRVPTRGPSPTLSEIPSLSGDSQSQSTMDSQESGSWAAEAEFRRSKAAKVKAEEDTDFVLQPGEFDVMLCVDNCEIYGGGSSSNKEIMVKEINKNKVPHDIRKLNIGDFTWIAKEKNEFHPDIVQISAVHRGESFNQYVMPTKKIAGLATRANRLSVKHGKLQHKGRPVRTTSCKTALHLFLRYLSKYTNIVLVGHNINRFDTRVLLLHLRANDLQRELLKVVVGFLDTLPLLKERFPGQPSYKQVELLRGILGVEYEAHNALADVRSLQTLFLRASPTTELKEKHTLASYAAVALLERQLERRGT